MKKLLLLITTLLLLINFNSNGQGKKIVGDWELNYYMDVVKAKEPNFADIPNDELEMFLKFYIDINFTFNENKTGIVIINSLGEKKIFEFNYVVKRKTIIMTHKDGVIEKMNLIKNKNKILELHMIDNSEDEMIGYFTKKLNE